MMQGDGREKKTATPFNNQNAIPIDPKTPEGIAILKRIMAENTGRTTAERPPIENVTASRGYVQQEDKPKKTEIPQTLQPKERPKRFFRFPDNEDWKNAHTVGKISFVTRSVFIVGTLWAPRGIEEIIRRKLTDEKIIGQEERTNKGIRNAQVIENDEELREVEKERLRIKFDKKQGTDFTEAKTAMERIRGNPKTSLEAIPQRLRRTHREQISVPRSGDENENGFLEIAYPYALELAKNLQEITRLLSEAKKLEGVSVMEIRLKLEVAVQCMKKYVTNSIEGAISNTLADPETVEKLVRGVLRKAMSQKTLSVEPVLNLGFELSLEERTALGYLWKNRKRITTLRGLPKPNREAFTSLLEKDNDNKGRELHRKLSSPNEQPTVLEIENYILTAFSRKFMQENPGFSDLPRVVQQKYVDLLLKNGSLSMETGLEETRMERQKKVEQLSSSWDDITTDNPIGRDRKPLMGIALFKRLTTVAARSNNPIQKQIAQDFLTALFCEERVSAAVVSSFGQLAIIHAAIPVGFGKQELEGDKIAIDGQRKATYKGVKIPAKKIISPKDLVFAGIHLLSLPETFAAFSGLTGRKAGILHAPSLLSQTNFYQDAITNKVTTALKAEFAHDLLSKQFEQVEADTMYANAGFLSAVNSLESALFEETDRQIWARAMTNPHVAEIMESRVVDTIGEVKLLAGETNEAIITRALLNETVFTVALITQEGLNPFMPFVHLLTDDATSLSDKNPDSGNQPDFSNKDLGTVSAEILSTLISKMKPQMAVETMEEILRKLAENSEMQDDLILVAGNSYLAKVYASGMRAARGNEKSRVQASQICHEILDAVRHEVFSEISRVSMEGLERKPLDWENLYIPGVKALLKAMGKRPQGVLNAERTYYPIGEPKNSAALAFYEYNITRDNFPRLEDRGDQKDNPEPVTEIPVFSKAPDNVQMTDGRTLGQKLGLQNTQPIYGSDEAEYFTTELMRMVGEVNGLTATEAVGSLLDLMVQVKKQKELEKAGEAEKDKPDYSTKLAEVERQYKERIEKAGIALLKNKGSREMLTRIYRIGKNLAAAGGLELHSRVETDRKGVGDFVSSSEEFSLEDSVEVELSKVYVFSPKRRNPSEGDLSVIKEKIGLETHELVRTFRPSNSTKEINRQMLLGKACCLFLEEHEQSN